MSTQLSRRVVLAGVVGWPLLAACGSSTDRPAGVDLLDGTLTSRFWPGQTIRWRLARPARKSPVSAINAVSAISAVSAPQPLVVALHGHGGDADWPFDEVHIARQVAATGLAVASVDGGDFYWHARSSGIDPGHMVLADLLPLMAANGLATAPIGLIGWSMGGYGALLLASRLGPRRVAGVVAVSAALWQSPGDSAAGAFDNADDFKRNDVFAAKNKLRAIPVRLECGLQDPFIVANQAFARDLPHAAATFEAGAHASEYWAAHIESQMRWLQRRLR